ncbi:MAG TPA: hypothetical protein VGH44_03680 [Candidatus Saccharimonadia bacterium]
MLVGTAQPAQAAAGINQQINFQGRLLTAAGAVVPDGTYNMEFKIWQGGNGCVSGCTSANADVNNGGTLKWTEDWIYGTGSPDNRVTVKNGYYSVSLGSITAFGSNVDWNQDTLWLSMNVGDTSNQASFATSGGYLIPFKRLASAVYALQANNANQLGTIAAANYLQFGTGNLQADTSTNNAININKNNATGNLIRIQSSGADAFIVNNNGDLQFGANGSHKISIATTGTNAVGNGLTLQAGNAGAGTTGFAGGALTLQGGNAAGTTGNANGGDVMLYGGSAVNSGTAGNVVLAYNGSSAVGGVGIGKTPTSGVALDVSGAAAVSGNFTVASTGLFTANGGTSIAKTISANAGTISVESLALTTPANTSGTNVANGINITPTIGNSTAGTNTANLINIGAVTGNAQTTLNAISIGALTGTAAAETALSVGSGWDNVINSAGALNFKGSGASTWDIGNNTLSLQTTNNGGITTGSGNVTLGGATSVASNKTFTANGDALFKDATVSATAFQVQNASSTVLGVDTSANQVLFGASGLAGKLVVYDGTGSSNYITLQTTGSMATNYTIKFPSAAPSASGQCLQSSGSTPFSTLIWGSCSGSGGGGTQTVVLSPEYPGAVFSPVTGSNNSGYMQSDHTTSTLSSGQGYKHSFYQWSTAQTTDQSYDIITEWQLPSSFTSFVSSSWKVWSLSTGASGLSPNVEMMIKDSNDATCYVSNQTVLSSTVPTTFSSNTWQQTTLTSPSCTTLTAGTNITIDIRVHATSTSGTTEIGELQFQWQ